MMLIVALLLAVGRFSGWAVGPSAHPPIGPSAHPTFVYVANQASGKVTVIDASSDTVVSIVDFTSLGFSAHPKPHHIVVEPDGSYWYVSLIGDNVVVKLDRANHVVAKAATEIPGLLALDPKRDVLYATRTMSAVNAPARIAVIDCKTMTPEEVEVLIPRPHALALSSDGRYAYAGSLSMNRIAVYDARTERVGLVDVPGDTTHVMVQFAVSPDGRTLVATGQLSSRLLVFDLTKPAAPRLTHTVAVGTWPWHVAFAPDGRTVWVPNQRSDNVSIVDTRTWQVVGTVTSPAFAQPHGIAISADGLQVFVSNHNTGHSVTMGGVGMAMTDANAPAQPGRVVVIDARHRAVAHRIDTAPDGSGLGMAGAKP